jgi:uncharacterized protein HemX
MNPDPVTPVSPYPVPPRRVAPPPPPRPVTRTPQARQRPTAFSRVARAVGILLLIAILAAIIAGAVLLLTDAGQNTNVGELLKQEISDEVQTLKDFIQENTQ